ncbi:DUF488 domain-containing protein [Dehalococcoidales bacterium]|nr:DUF488 domain-containing protein [Dehalococcoidales bacterium]
MNQRGIVYSLGTSTRSNQEFLDLLLNNNIETVVDVRRFPTSKFEHFNQDQLSKLLVKAGIDYSYLGEVLGGYRSGGYQSFIITEEFKKGLHQLEKIAEQKRVAMVCAERFPWRCHRRFISLELERRGWKVVHIIDSKRSWLAK